MTVKKSTFSGYSNVFHAGEPIQSLFGPLMGYTIMTDQTITALLDIFNNLSPDHPDFGENLAGQIKRQPKMPPEAVDILLAELGGFINNFMQTQVATEKSNVMTAWYVDQRAGEYNPLHSHGSYSLSCVGYLAIPEDLKKLWEKQRNSNDGVIHFSYGQATGATRNSQIFWPLVGEFYIFPAYLLHAVYPFNCEGSRISFSMNIDYE